MTKTRNKILNYDVKIGIRVSSEVKAEIVRIAKGQSVSMNSIIREALDLYLASKTK